MPDLPVMLRVAGRKAVVIGGGAVARRRAASLCQCGASVTVIAPDVPAPMEGAVVERRPYREGDLRDAFVVVVATDDPQVNDAVRREAARAGVLVNAADEPDRGDLSVMAHDRRGPITLGVATDGISAQAAAAIRDELLLELDQDWVALLETVEPYRQALRQQAPDGSARREALLRLANQESVAILKEGGVTALRAHCEQILRQAVKP